MQRVGIAFIETPQAVRFLRDHPGAELTLSTALSVRCGSDELEYHDQFVLRRPILKSPQKPDTHAPYKAWMREHGVDFEEIGPGQYAICGTAKPDVEYDFTDPQEALRCVKSVINRLSVLNWHQDHHHGMLHTRPFTPLIVVMDVDADGAGFKLFRTPNEFEEWLAQVDVRTEPGDPGPATEMRECMADCPDANLFVYAHFPIEGGNTLTVPMWRDGDKYVLDPVERHQPQ